MTWTQSPCVSGSARVNVCRAALWEGKSLMVTYFALPCMSGFFFFLIKKRDKIQRQEEKCSRLDGLLRK